MSGAIPSFPQYAFMAWCSVKSTGTVLPLPFILLSYRSAFMYYLSMLQIKHVIYHSVIRNKCEDIWI
jgi:hypothetical protein